MKGLNFNDLIQIISEVEHKAFIKKMEEVIKIVNEKNAEYTKSLAEQPEALETDELNQATAITDPEQLSNTVLIS